MSQRPVRPFALFAMGLASAIALLACGGGSVDRLKLGGDGGDTCEVLPCPVNAPWNPDTCTCEAVDDAGAPLVVDAMAQCPAIACPSSSVLTFLEGACVCISRPRDAGRDVTAPAEDAATQQYYDATSYAEASYPSYDAQYSSDTGCPFYNYNPCQSGYTLSPGCSCELCSNTCPVGETPASGCDGCTACTATCPTGFDYGPSCSCVPHGVDAGPPLSDSGDTGVSCVLEGYTTCAADSWCALGTCPNGTTQYGCYCDHDGNSTCSLACPVPPPCEIPGQAACPFGQECIYGSCATDPTADLLVCNCSSYGNSGSASCYTASCGDGGGAQYLPDAGAPNAGAVTCLLEGYYSCNAGSFCPVGTCPDGSQYGCFCNQDGTSTCNLACPTPPPCQIPGEGACPYGTSCVFGCGGGSSGTGLSCYCGWGGSANCNTVPCSQITSSGGAD